MKKLFHANLPNLFLYKSRIVWCSVTFICHVIIVTVITIVITTSVIAIIILSGIKTLIMIVVATSIVILRFINF